MILRRFMTHVSDQNWLAVGLDFAIVVFGVYIGLQLGNWDDAREERDRERAILQRLHVDFEQLELLDTYAAATAEQGFRGADFLLDAIAAGRLGEYEETQLLPAIQTALTVSAPNGPSSTYTEIIASGQVSLLQNSELREWLATYDKGQEAYGDLHDNLYQIAMQEVFPLWREAVFDDTVDEAGQVSMGPVIAFDFDRLAGDPELIYALRTARRIMGIHYSYTNHLANMSNQISLILEEELGEGPSEQIVKIREQRAAYRKRTEEIAAEQLEVQKAQEDGVREKAEGDEPTATPVPEDALPDDGPPVEVVPEEGADANPQSD